MTTDLVRGQISKFKREQGFGTIKLDDGREVPFDASHCTIPMDEGTDVSVRVGKAKWGGGFKATHVEPLAAGSGPTGVIMPLSLEDKVGRLQSAHLLAGLTEAVLAKLVTGVYGTWPTTVDLLAIVDLYYLENPTRAQDDGYLRHDWQFAAETSDVLAEIAALMPDAKLPRQVAWTERGDGGVMGTLAVTMPDGAPLAVDVRSLDDVAALVNRALEGASDGRRMYALATNGDWVGYYLLSRDRAKQVHAILPFAIAP